MATNPPSGDSRRRGAVRRRSQVKNPRNKTWVKRNKTTGQFMSVKSKGAPHKGVRKEH